MSLLIVQEFAASQNRHFDSCSEFIRTVPVLQHDPDKPEDLDTDQDDRIADETRYSRISSQQKLREPSRDIRTYRTRKWGQSEYGRLSN
jgi:hypothetical protein